MKNHRNMGSLLIFLACCFLSANAQRPGTQPPPRREGQKQYSIEQATSERAQLHTMAFSGLAFITGNYGADCFFPPGKVADFFGFQYMRDNDKNEMGHNTDFLTCIANNVISILSPEQLMALKDLATKQAILYDDFARKRWVLIKAFRESLTSDKQLNKDEVIKYVSVLYSIDADLSYNRAILYGQIANSLTAEQKNKLGKLDFSNSATWPVLPETLDKRSMSHRAHVAVMTYASEFFSWYAGSVKADVYFCPERHGTYFGGFFLKDYPAMQNPGYNISTALTGDKGEQFIECLTAVQSECLISTTSIAKKHLNEIVSLRDSVSIEFRKVLKSQTPDKQNVYSLINRYGELDGELSYNYATCFSSIYKSLTPRQKEELYKLRNLDVTPNGTYIYSDPVDSPRELDCNFLFR